MEQGITQSLISDFLADPFSFYIKYGLGLEEPREPDKNLMWGDSFHKALELTLEQPERIKDLPQDVFDDIIRQTNEHLRSKFPSAPGSYIHTIQRMLLLYDDSFKTQPYITEKEFSKPYITKSGNHVKLLGKIDALSADGKTLVEHKCKGSIDQLQTAVEIPVDMQVLLYCYASGAREVIYDLIMIPEAQYMLPQKAPGQTNANWADNLFYNRQGDSYPIKSKKHMWIQQIGPKPISDEAILDFRFFTLDPIIDRICAYYEWICKPDFDWTHSKYHNHLFYRTPIRHFDPGLTPKFKRAYFDFLTGQADLSSLVPTQLFRELHTRT